MDGMYNVDITQVLKDRNGDDIPEQEIFVCSECAKKGLRKVEIKDVSEKLTLGAAIETALNYIERDDKGNVENDRVTNKRRYKMMRRIERAAENEQTHVMFSESEIQEIDTLVAKTYPSPKVSGQISLLLEEAENAGEKKEDLPPPADPGPDAQESKEGE